MADVTKEQVIEYLEGLNIVQLNALVKDLEDKWDVKAGNSDDVKSETGTPATRIVNKFSAVCDTLAARTDTFANFSTGGNGAGVPWIICTSTQLQNLNGFLLSLSLMKSGRIFSDLVGRANHFKKIPHPISQFE